MMTTRTTPTTTTTTGDIGDGGRGDEDGPANVVVGYFATGSHATDDQAGREA